MNAPLPYCDVETGTYNCSKMDLNNLTAKNGFFCNWWAEKWGGSLTGGLESGVAPSGLGGGVVPSLVGWEMGWLSHWWVGRWSGSLTGGFGGRGITLIGGLEVRWLSHWWAGRWGGSFTSGLEGEVVPSLVGWLPQGWEVGWFPHRWVGRWGITLIGGLEVGWLSYWWTRGGMQEDFLPIAKRWSFNANVTPNRPSCTFSPSPRFIPLD